MLTNNPKVFEVLTASSKPFHTRGSPPENAISFAPIDTASFIIFKHFSIVIDF
jgi:hypothetical protein